MNLLAMISNLKWCKYRLDQDESHGYFLTSSKIKRLYLHNG